MYSETVFILLFIVATAVALVVRRLRIPYTVALVLAGIALGFFHAFKPPHLTKELLFSVFLPGLLFEAAFHIDFQHFRRNKIAITSLAVPGVIVAIVLTTIILASFANTLDFLRGFDWRYALVFGALISATDPIAVVAVFRKLGAPKRLSILLEGESLLNDGTGIVFFTLSLGLVAGTTISAGGLLLQFLVVVGMGALIGTGVGLIVSRIIQQVDDPMIEITLTTIAAYGSFAAAEQFHYSGVIATVAAGMLCGNYGARTGMSPSTRISVETFWEYIAFALNSIVFLLIGFEEHISIFVASWPMILLAYLSVTLGRGAVILAVSGLLRKTRERIPWSWSAVLTWGGLRGALPMVLVLSLAPDFPHRDLLVTITFGVVIISILLHGLTISPLLRRLGIVEGQEERELYEFTRGKLQAANAALHEIEKMSGTRFKDSDLLSALQNEYEARIEENEKDIRDLKVDQEKLGGEEANWARRHLFLVERNYAINAFHQGILSQDVYDRLLADIDARLLRLESGEEETEEEPGNQDEKPS